MPFSYNSHSGQFCQFGRGHLESCVLRAIEIGYAYFGLTESMPRYKEEQLYKEEVKVVFPLKLSVTFLFQFSVYYSFIFDLD